MRFALDSNLLVYAFDISDSVKQAQASDIVLRALACDLAIPAQVLGEFLAVVRRKAPDRIAEATVYAQDLAVAASILPTSGEHIVLGGGNSVRHGLQFWDSVIIEVARAGGAEILLTEDMQDGRDLGGIRLINPFNPANGELIDALLVPAA